MKADMFDATTTTLNVSCSCRNNDDACINATFFGDMMMCPKKHFDVADKFLYEGRSRTRFPYTHMRKTDSCNFVYTSKFEPSGVLQSTSLNFWECNDKVSCDSWSEQKLKPLEANELDWKNVTSLRCAFTSKPGACPMVDVRNATVPRHLSLTCRCNDSFCAVKAATMLFGGNLLTATTTYYARVNGSISETFVLEGINAMPIYHLATNGSCELVMLKINHNTTKCGRVRLDRTYKHFYIDRPFVRCVCEDPAKGCDKQLERETAKELFGLLGQCRNSSQFENYWQRDARYPKGEYDWGPAGIASEDLLLCGQMVHLINYESTKEQNRKFAFLIKKSTWGDIEAISKTQWGFRNTLQCVDLEYTPKHEKMYLCSCIGLNQTCNDWPGLFGRYFRQQLAKVHYADASFKCGDEKCNTSGCFGMYGRVQGSGALEYSAGCLVPADPQTSGLAQSFERFGRWDTNVCEEYAGGCIVLRNGVSALYTCCCENQDGCRTEGVRHLERMPFQNATEVDTFGDDGKWRNIHDRITKQQANG
ncbi:hypothetical protein AAVH_32722 [Aphelenchoides avenae]|nr:hypothetical protein AAVH_32722 [Aphelenchus avenae]